MTQPDVVPAAVPYAPAPADPAVKSDQRRPRTPAWYARPPVLAVAGLIALILLMLLFRLVGPLWTAAVVVVLAAGTFVAVLIWRRKWVMRPRRASRTPGGLRARFARARGTGSRSQGSGLRSARSASGGASGRGRTPGHSRLSRMMGRTGRSNAPGGERSSSAKRTRSGFGRAMDAVRGRVQRRSGERTRERSSAGGSLRRSRFAWPSGGGFGWGRAKANGRERTNHAPRTNHARPGPVEKIRRGLGLSPRANASKRTNKGKGASPDVRATRPRPAVADKANIRPTAPQRNPPDAPPPNAPANPLPQHSTNDERKGVMPDETGIQFNDDQSLQRWGANLKGAAPAASEVARLYAEAEAAKDRFNQLFGHVATQGENDLPTSPRLLADVQSVKSRASQAGTADDWRAVTADAENLPGMYRREHETDQDRLETPRGGLAQEKRADVTHASQDN